MSTNGYHNGTMNTSMVKPKFLHNQEDLGIVAVGFSGGQVVPRLIYSCGPP